MYNYSNQYHISRSLSHASPVICMGPPLQLIAFFLRSALFVTFSLSAEQSHVSPTRILTLPSHYSTSCTFTAHFASLCKSPAWSYVVRPSFPMMTITSSMMMMIMSCLVDPVGAEVPNQSNSGLQHSSTLGAWVCRAGCGAGGRVKSRF